MARQDVPWPRRVYRRLLLLFPFEFRREFGGEMAEVFEAQRTEARARGGLAMLTLWLDTLIGFVRTAPREHLGVLRQDMRYVLRTLKTSPAFTITALVALALGIGGNIAVFSLVELVLLNPLPVPDPSRLVSVHVIDQQSPGFTPISTDNFRDLRAQQRSFTHVAAFAFAGVRVTPSRGEPEEGFALAVTGDYFSVLGVGAARGRTIQPEDDGAPGAHPVAVIGHRLWATTFGGEPSVVGETVLLNGHPFTIVGVLPQTFRGTVATFEPDLYIPLPMYDTVAPGTEWFAGRRWRWLNVLARLRDDTTIEEARAAVALFGQQLAQAYPDINRGRGLAVLPLTQSAVGANNHDTIATAGGVLLAIAGVVLLIACVNLANLLLARAAARAREVALRTALGASRARIVRQLLTESVLLGLGGGAAGLLLAFWIQRWLWAARPANLLRPALEPSISAEVVFFAIAISVLTGVLFGLVPALNVSRTDVISTLNEAGRQPSPPGSSRLRGALIIGEVALSVVALAAAGLFIRSLQGAQEIDPGFAAERMVRLNYNLRGSAAGSVDPNGFHRRVIARLTEVPGVVAAAVATRGPLSGGGGDTITVPGHEPPPGTRGFFVQTAYTTPGYFDTTGIPLLRGRDISADDRADTRLVVIVNETMAQQFWTLDSAVGRQFSFASIPGQIEVIGVARDSKYDTIGEPAQPFLYFSLGQRSGGLAAPFTLLVASAGPPGDVVPSLRAAFKAIDPSIPLTNVITGADLLHMALWAPRMAATIVSAFAMLALVLAAVGLYGVTAYAVAQARHEIGLRMALGATPRGILSMVVGRGVGLAAVGAAIGMAVGMAAVGGIGSLLYGVDARDPMSFVAAPVALIAVTVLACAIPARRAARLDPTVTLRG